MGTYEYKYEIHANGSADEEEIVDALCEAGLYEVTVEKTLDIQAFINMQSNAPDDTYRYDYLPKSHTVHDNFPCSM